MSDAPDAADSRWQRALDAVAPSIGERAATLVSWRLFRAAGADAWVERTRSVIAEGGEQPEHAQVTEAERLLLDWAAVVGAGGAVPEQLGARLRESFTDSLRAQLDELAVASLDAARRLP